MAVGSLDPLPDPGLAFGQPHVAHALERIHAVVRQVAVDPAHALEGSFDRVADDDDDDRRNGRAERGEDRQGDAVPGHDDRGDQDQHGVERDAEEPVFERVAEHLEAPQAVHQVPGVVLVVEPHLEARHVVEVPLREAGFDAAGQLDLERPPHQAEQAAQDEDRRDGDRENVEMAQGSRVVDDVLDQERHAPSEDADDQPRAGRGDRPSGMGPEKAEHGDRPVSRSAGPGRLLLRFHWGAQRLP